MCVRVCVCACDACLRIPLRCIRDAHVDMATSRAAASVDGLVHEAVTMLEHKEKADRVAEIRSAKRLASSVYPFKPAMGVRTPRGPYLGTLSP